MSSLRAALDEIAADVPTYGDLDRAIATADRERRRRDTVIVSLVAVAAVVALVVGLLAVGGDDTADPQPVRPTPTPTPTKDASPASEWPGAVRSLATVVDEARLGPTSNPWRGWTDPADTADARVDILLVAGWGLRLRDESMQSDRRGSVEYGLVVDTDGDRSADCRLALRSAGSEWRVLLENVASGERDERVGPPYGYPFEFGFPTADGTPGNAASIYIEFLGSWQEPCSARDDRIRWYAYAVLTERGRPTAWDFAPDDAWLQTLPRLAVEFGGRVDRTEWGRGLPLRMGP